MKNSIIIKSKIGKFNKKIEVSGDKSISIRWILFSSIAYGVSKAKNILNTAKKLKNDYKKYLE